MSLTIEQQYLQLVNDIIENGNIKGDRTGTGTLSLFGRQLRHNFKDGFPLMTLRKQSLKDVFTELKWFLSGRNDLKFLLERKCYIWVGDFYKRYLSYCEKSSYDYVKNPDGTPYSRQEFIQAVLDDRLPNYITTAGRNYSKQWREYNGTFDQIQDVIHKLENDPDSRRIILDAWNPTEIDMTLLPPCHLGFHAYTRELSFDERTTLYKGNLVPEALFDDILDANNIPKRALSMQVFLRSNDIPLGTWYNISSYALLQLMLAKRVNMIPEELLLSITDAHIYSNQVEPMKELIKRQPKGFPTVTLSDREVKDFSEYEWSDITLSNYSHHPPINIPLSN